MSQFYEIIVFTTGEQRYAQTVKLYHFYFIIIISFSKDVQDS